MNAIERATRSIVAQWIEDEGLAPEIAPAIVAELVEAHPAQRCVVVEGDDRAAIAVLDGARAWLLGASSTVASADQVIRELAAACRERGATRLWSGGPPRWYLRSGLGDGSREARVFQSLGAQEKSRHLDLWVATDGVDAGDASVGATVTRVETADELAELGRWLRADFSEAWAEEARAAFGRRGVFVARFEGQIAAFAAHSGHCAAAGMFGPLAARASARGRGLGAAVTRAALRDLGARGFGRACVPWVEPAVVAFYERVAAVFSRRQRVLYAVDLTAR